LSTSVSIPPTTPKKADQSLSALSTAAGTEGIQSKANSSRTASKETSEVAVQDASIAKKTVSEAGLVLRQELGNGSQSSVHSAWKIKDGSFRCIKRFDKEKATQSSLGFLKEEYRVMVEVGQHPCVTEAFQLFQDDLFFYIELPLYKGGDFSQLKQNATKAGVCCNEAWWSNVFQQALQGLAHLHGKGYMHCDVKEPNLMIKNDNYHEPEVVLIDLGIVQKADEKRTAIYGTPGYIAPEVWDTKEWTPQGDAFSFGVVILQMMTGKVPDPSRPQNGVFTENTKNLKDVKVATKTRKPDVSKMIACGTRLRILTEHLLTKEAICRTTVSEALAFLESETK
jgi:serine/threonine protein kinase